ncbi:MAG: hypothetical protein JXA71_02510 [Chitinispirillaceae bacterium]|nr:hypothetical protein [Chitinispirillaceae bacterium]
MNFDIVVKGFRNKGARMVVARHLVREEGITLPEALAMTGHLPVTLFRSINRVDVAVTLERYGKLGIDAEAVETGPVQGKKARQPEALPVPAVTIQAQGRSYPVSPATAIHHTVPDNRDPPALPAAKDSSGRGMKRMRQAIINVTILAVILTLAVSFFFLVSRYAREKQGIAVNAKNRSPFSILPESTALVRHPLVTAIGSRQLPAASPARKPEDVRYVDSAKARGNDLESAIHFYRMAIAFNQRNINAWCGLIDAYHQNGRTADEDAARAEMKKLFGDAVGSIERIVRPFGQLTEFHYGDSGTLSVEYRTTCPNERDKLLKEIFLVARALSTAGDCSRISVFASTGGSKGLVVHCGSREGFSSFAEFEKKAVMYFFETAATGPGNIRDR